MRQRHGVAMAAEQFGTQAKWERGDLRLLPANWAERVDCVTFTLSEFGCFDDPDDNQAVLDEVARVLVPGSRFVLDIVANRDGLVRQDETDNCLHVHGHVGVDVPRQINFHPQRGDLPMVTHQVVVCRQHQLLFGSIPVFRHRYSTV